jgi:hypothetical protein
MNRPKDQCPRENDRRHDEREQPDLDRLPQNVRHVIRREKSAAQRVEQKDFEDNDEEEHRLVRSSAARSPTPLDVGWSLPSWVFISFSIAVHPPSPRAE